MYLNYILLIFSGNICSFLLFILSLHNKQLFNKNKNLVFRIFLQENNFFY